MNKTEYLAMLTAHLGGLDETEKENALRYYAEYFDEAGEENEQEVIRQLGSPQDIAQEIKDAVAGGAQNGTAYTLCESYKKTVNGLAYAARHEETPLKKGAAAVILAIVAAPLWALLVILVFVLGVGLSLCGIGAAVCAVYTLCYAFAGMGTAIGNASLCAAAGFLGLSLAIGLVSGGISVLGGAFPKTCALIAKLGAGRRIKEGV